MSTPSSRVRFTMGRTVFILGIVSAGTAMAAAAATNLTAFLARVPAPPATTADAIARMQGGSDRLVAPIIREAQTLQFQVAQPAGGGPQVSPEALAKMTREQQMAYAMQMARQQSAQMATPGAALRDPQAMELFSTCISEAMPGAADSAVQLSLEAAEQKMRTELDRLQNAAFREEQACGGSEEVMSPAQKACRVAAHGKGRAAALASGTQFLLEVTPKLTALRTDVGADITKCAANAAQVAAGGGAIGRQGQSVHGTLVARIGSLAQLTGQTTAIAASADILGNR
jgi:hypothetical protein